MELAGKVVIVTGAASGIGRALATRFAAEGADVVATDLSADAVNSVAAQIGGIGMVCDVTDESQVQQLVAAAEARLGPVDMFCSNAGICLGTPGHAASASNEVWQKNWEVHVMAHVYAARAVLPAMIARGDGYLLQMASAAGLLSQIDDAAYSATKHAAVGLAESLHITHQRDGIKVSVICPQYVATPMLGYAESSVSDATLEADLGDPQGVITPQQLTDAVVEGIRREAFLILPHPQVRQYIQYKAKDYDRWLANMAKLRTRILDEAGSTSLAVMHKLV